MSLSELIGGFEMLGDDGTEADKLRFLFKVYDIDGKWGQGAADKLNL